MRKRDSERAARKLIRKLILEVGKGNHKNPFDTAEFILSSDDKMRVMVKTLLELDFVDFQSNKGTEPSPFLDCAMIIATQYYLSK